MAKRAKQASLAGLEPPSHPEVDKAAESVTELDEKFRALRDKKKAAVDKLIAAMRKHGVTSYRDRSVTPNLVIDLSSVDKAKVKKVDADPDFDDGDHGEHGTDDR
jgi:hypothetical protein